MLSIPELRAVWCRKGFIASTLTHTLPPWLWHRPFGLDGGSINQFGAILIARLLNKSEHRELIRANACEARGNGRTFDISTIRQQITE
ncbi:hypothetical protein JOE11_003933 [Robbsia andropogonis]